MSVNLNVGSVVELKLDTLAYGGDAVGRYNQHVIFTALGVPLDVVKVRITVKKKTYSRAEIIELIQPARERCQPRCRSFGQCGGCQWQMIDYTAQLAYKSQLVQESLHRIGKLKDIKVCSTIGMTDPWYYRNRAQYPLRKTTDNKLAIGYYRAGTHQVVDLQYCPIQHELINRVIPIAKQIIQSHGVTIYDETRHQGFLRHLVMRAVRSSSQLLVTFVTNGDEPMIALAREIMDSLPDVVGVTQNINTAQTNVILGKRTLQLAGEPYVYERIGVRNYRISSLSFFQVNTLQAEVLYEKIKQYAELTGSDTVVDAYAGTGTISLFLADKVKKIFCIEREPNCVIDAQQNIKINEVTNCEVLHGDVETLLPQLSDVDVIILNPPRKGCSRLVLEHITKILPPRIVYVSCNPTCLSRDLSVLAQFGYRTVEVQPIDMFPHTYHIESVAKIVKK